MEAVDVVVPSYNHGLFVERTLWSVLRQSTPPTSLLVIDDGSRDDSAQRIARVLEHATFPVEFVVQRNRGLCATLNRGLTAGRAPLFAYIGSDDLWHPNFLADRVSSLAEHQDAVLAYGHAYLIDAQDRVLTTTSAWSSYAAGDALPMLLAGEAPSSASVLYRRSVLESVGGWNVCGRLEDYDLYLRLAPRGAFALNERVRSAWRRHGANASMDISFMLRETLAAQARRAPELGLTRRQRAMARRAVYWRAGYSYSEADRRWRAWEASVRGWRCNDPSESLRRLARLTLPKRVRQGILQKRGPDRPFAQGTFLLWGNEGLH